MDDVTPVASSLRLAPLDNDRVSDDIVTPSFVPDTVPFTTRLLALSLDPVAPHISADPSVNQSGRSPGDEPISSSSSQIPTPFPLASQVIPTLGSNTAEIGRLDAADHTLDPNRCIMSRPFTPSFPDVDEYNLRPEDSDLSETSGPSQ